MLNDSKTRLIFWGVVMVVVVILVKFLNSKNLAVDKKVTKYYEYIKKDYLMTRTENEFFDKLHSLFGEQYYIFPQVHLSAFIDHKVKNGQNWKAAFSHINQKSVDYVLCDKQWRRPLLAIELDDTTHSRPDRIERDGTVEQILTQANMPLLRIAGNNSVTTEELRALITSKITAD